MNLDNLTPEELFEHVGETYLIPDYKVSEILNHLRWQGPKIRPEGWPTNKSYTYRTMQPFAWSKLRDRQILALILAASNDYVPAHTARIIGIKPENSSRWTKIIKDRFGHGEVLFPEPNEEYLKRKQLEPIRKSSLPPPKKTDRKEVALFILNHKGITTTFFKQRFYGYNLNQVQGIFNSLINKKKDYLQDVSEGREPNSRLNAEVKRVQENIDKHDRDMFKSVKDLDQYSYIKRGAKDETNYQETEINIIDDGDFDSVVDELRISRERGDSDY